MDLQIDKWGVGYVCVCVRVYLYIEASASGCVWGLGGGVSGCSWTLLSGYSVPVMDGALVVVVPSVCHVHAHGLEHGRTGVTFRGWRGDL